MLQLANRPFELENLAYVTDFVARLMSEISYGTLGLAQLAIRQTAESRAESQGFLQRSTDDW